MSVRSPVRVGALAVTALLLLQGPPAHGGGEERDEYDGRRREAALAASRRLVAFGNWCRGRSYRALARRQYEAALRLDPDSGEARSALGHRREKGKWRAPATPEPSIDAAASSGAEVTRLERESETAHAEAAAPFAALAAWCAAAGLEPEARSAWSDALHLDPGSTEARRALNLGDSDTAWLRPSEEGPRVFAARCRGIADRGLKEFRDRVAGDPSALECGPTADGTKAVEARFSATSTHGEAPAGALVEDMVHAESLWRGVGLVLARSAKPVRFRVDAVASKKEYLALLDAVPDRSPEWKARKADTGSVWAHDGWVICWARRAERIRERVSHDTAHFLFDRYAPGDVPPWLAEGGAMFTATVLRGQSECFCVVSGASAVDRDAKVREDWDGETCALVLRGEDPPIGDLLVAGWNDLGRASLLKARSLVAWMALHSPLALRAALRKSTKEATPESALLRAFGAPPETLERRWRLWVRRQ